MLKSLKNPISKIIALFIVWRFTLFLIAFISPTVIPKFGGTFPYYQNLLMGSGLPHFIWSFANFDGVHYLNIAKVGYSYQYTQAFFPLYPILIKAGSIITFGNLIISGLLISNLAFLGALIIFYKLVKKHYGENIALWSSIFCLSFPTSFYFGSIYNEGIFFLLIVSSFYLADQNKIWLASIIGAFSSATRLVGVFMAPVMAIKKRKFKIIPLLIIPVGFLLYVIYLAITFHNPLYFLSSQEIFGQGRSTNHIILLPQVFYRYFKIMATTHGALLINSAFELLSTIFAFATLIIGYKKIKLDWLIFSLLAIILPTLTGTLASMPRYIVIAFPIYIILAQIKSNAAKIIIAVIFLAMLTITTTIFTQGYWVA